MAMDKEYIRQQLPETPPDGMLDWVRKNAGDELGGEYIIFSSERFPVAPSFEELITDNRANPRYEWGARCSCTACGDEFVTQKVRGHRAIRIVTGEDGLPYTLEPGENWGAAVGDGGMIEDAFEGEEMTCPNCLHKGKVIHASSVRGGRTKRLMVVAVQNVERYTAIVYWMTSRTVDESGLSCVSIKPVYAYVLTEKGNLVRYSRCERCSIYSTLGYRNEWTLMKNNEDAIDMVYPDWGSINNRKAGACIYPMYPDLEGTTGEKTALDVYLDADGYRPVAYLKFWKNYRNIENVVRCGQGRLVADIVSQSYCYSYSIQREAQKYLDLTQRKPNRMLRMTAEEFRALRKTGRSIRTEQISFFREYKGAGGKYGFVEFMDALAEFTVKGIHAACEIMRQSPRTDLEKISRYLEKNGLSPREVHILNDARMMARRLNPGQELSHEELWPRNLTAAHDRLDRQLREMNSRGDAEAARKIDEAFGAVKAEYADLEWNDGELCIILPNNSAELTREGQVLRHCVGGYDHRHVQRTDVIFFVRKYRRPERSYYTLDIDMKHGGKERQLHGYGNERHGPNKEYHHTIPKKVRDFVDRWKREKLSAWIAQQNAENNRRATA